MKIDTEILCSFIDGELDEQKAEVVRAALETDQTLRHEYEGLRKTAKLVRSLPRVPAPPELASMITAHSERNQLLGGTEPGPSRPSKFRWTMSMAASLLIGASLGILGYRNWPGPVAPTSEVSESVVMVDEYKAKDSPMVVLAPSSKTALSSKRGLNYEAKAKQDLGRSDGEIVADLSIRDGSLTGAASKPRGGAYIAGGEELVTNERPLEAEQVQDELASATGIGGKEAIRAETAKKLESLGYVGDVSKSDGKSVEPNKDTRANEIGEQDTLAKKKSVPLEHQVLSNNYVNQSMAENLKFEAEPLNVKVVSQDSAKTLGFVQRWAQSNFLIDLNRASRESNFPAYSQVVYQGAPGKNTGAQIKNSIFVRTTRRQAQDIVGELQRQKPTVLSVAVKDEKHQLGDFANQRAQQQTLALGKPRELLGEDTKQKEELELKRELSQTAQQRLLKKSPNEYLYALSNQAQVVSLDDLVTVVVLVEDAPVAPPAVSEPSLPESQTKP